MSCRFCFPSWPYRYGMYSGTSFKSPLCHWPAHWCILAHLTLCRISCCYETRTEVCMGGSTSSHGFLQWYMHMCKTEIIREHRVAFDFSSEHRPEKQAVHRLQHQASSIPFFFIFAVLVSLEISASALSIANVQLLNIGFPSKKYLCLTILRPKQGTL